MTRVSWLPEAILDLQRLYDFISPHSPDAANRFIETLRHAAASLGEFPERGRPYDRAEGFRELIVPFGRRAYVMRYRIDADRVVIVRVWHAVEDRG